MLRSSRLNFGSWVEVSPIVPTRTVVAMSGRRDAEVGGAARIRADGDLGPAQRRGRRRVADAGDACACRAPRASAACRARRDCRSPARARRSRPASPPPKRTRRPGIAAARGASSALELALRERRACVRRTQLHGHRAARTSPALLVPIASSCAPLPIDRQHAGHFRVPHDDLARASRPRPPFPPAACRRQLEVDRRPGRGPWPG